MIASGPWLGGLRGRTRISERRTATHSGSQTSRRVVVTHSATNRSMIVEPLGLASCSKSLGSSGGLQRSVGDLWRLNRRRL